MFSAKSPSISEPEVRSLSDSQAAEQGSYLEQLVEGGAWCVQAVADCLRQCRALCTLPRLKRQPGLQDLLRQCLQARQSSFS